MKKNEVKFIKDKRNRMYKMNEEGMIIKLSIEEGLKIEKEFEHNHPSIPVPYTNLIKRNNQQ